MKTGEPLQIYRKRFIPSEIILLKNDLITEQTDDYIITKWKTLKPKATFDHGCSCYYLNKGLKISKYLRADNSLLYWYCDIVDYSYEESSNALTVTDLLADVIVYPDGQMKVVDLDEMADALEQGIITSEQISKGLRRLNELLTLLSNDQFSRLTAPLHQVFL